MQLMTPSRKHGMLENTSCCTLYSTCVNAYVLYQPNWGSIRTLWHYIWWVGPQTSISVWRSVRCVWRSVVGPMWNYVFLVISFTWMSHLRFTLYFDYVSRTSSVGHCETEWELMVEKIFIEFRIRWKYLWLEGTWWAWECSPGCFTNVSWALQNKE